MRTGARTDYIEGKTTCSYAIRTKLSSYEVTRGTKMIINMANFEFEFMHNGNFLILSPFLID